LSDGLLRVAWGVVLSGGKSWIHAKNKVTIFPFQSERLV
jgi:hypothetical protein